MRCQRFLKGEDRLVFAWAGVYPARPMDDEGRALELPALDERRDGSGGAAGQDDLGDRFLSADWGRIVDLSTDPEAGREHGLPPRRRC